MRFVAWRITRALLIAAIFAAALIGFGSLLSSAPKDYEITDANVAVELQRDGSLIVDEALTFDFSGEFSGAYREFPLNGRARVTDVTVSEDGEEYRESLNEKLDRAEEGTISWDRDLRPWRHRLALVAGLALGAVLVLTFLRTYRLAIPLTALVATLLLIYALPGTWLQRLIPAARERSARWQAFERWTRDFPRLDDDPPATLKLWRRILVYAVAFGTAERVAKSGRIPAPVGEEAASAGIWTAYAVHPGGFGAGFGGFSSGFASQVAPESSSGSGGGGFSGGGGGGFSGGGGGGAW